MLKAKKYYLISEVAEILNLPLYKLRYLEKSKQKLKVHKVNKRRYYTQVDIDYLKKYYKLETVNNNLNIQYLKATSCVDYLADNKFINKINHLIDQLHQEKERLNSYLNY